MLRAIVRTAAQVCEANDALIILVEGDGAAVVARHGRLPTRHKLGETYPLTDDTVSNRAIIQRRTIHLRDLGKGRSQFLGSKALQLPLGVRTMLVTPLLRDGDAIGAIGIRRTRVQPFNAKQIALLKTFADQAAIAIENARLSQQLEANNAKLSEALEQQTATAEILRIISSSPADLEPVFSALLVNAARLCGAHNGGIFRFVGDALVLAASYNVTPELRAHLESASIQPGPGGALRRAALELRPVQNPDASADSSLPVAALEAYRREGMRTAIAVPLLKENTLIGVIAFHRREVRPFSDKQIALLQTFADQAVIAIENVRLFNELQARTEQLTRSVGQLTALGDVGRALSSTLDLDAVLQTIVTRASQLAGADACSVFEYDEATEAFHLRATHDLAEEVVALARRTPTRKGEGVQGRMAMTRQPVQIPDIAEEDAYRGPLRDVLLRTGTRAVLAVPMLRDDQLIGGLTVNKRTPGKFSSEVIELLTTFATQSALAIQNARLFREIEEKSRQLEVASRHKSEFLANMSHELRTPLNAIIGFSEVLGERMFGDLNEKQEEYLKDIYASGTHLLSLINDILDLSKVEAGRMELELTDFDLPTAIDNALTLVRERAGRRSISVETAVDARLGQVRADERKIRQIVLNLLSNAIKFTPEGGRIEVRALPADESVEVAISDTGIGIAPEEQGAVFEEFRQVGASTAKQEGTGLGLTLCRKFVELHGGRIWVKSQPGVGSTFTFTIPMGPHRS